WMARDDLVAVARELVIRRKEARQRRRDQVVALGPGAGPPACARTTRARLRRAATKADGHESLRQQHARSLLDAEAAHLAAQAVVVGHGPRFLPARRADVLEGEHFRGRGAREVWPAARARQVHHLPAKAAVVVARIPAVPARRAGALDARALELVRAGEDRRCGGTSGGLRDRKSTRLNS